MTETSNLTIRLNLKKISICAHLIKMNYKLKLYTHLKKKVE